MVLSALIWLLALFCSTAAMRLRAPVQAAVPHVVAIVALGLVARDQGRGAGAGILLAAVGLYALGQTAWRNGAIRWLPRGERMVPRALGGGIAILVIAGIVTAVVVPLSPVSSDPQLDLRRGGLGDGGPRTVVSPFVEVGAQLGVRSDELLFTATTERGGYWRLTALDTYDPAEGIWTLENSYQPVEAELAPESAAGSYPSEVTIAGLGGIWVPAPREPITVSAPFALNWDAASGSVISRDSDLHAGDTLTFTADAAALDPASLPRRSRRRNE